MRGRKKQDNSKTKVISIRITEQQYEILNKNSWLRKEITKQVNEYLNTFIFANDCSK
jgi:hypothetical protein